MHQRLSVILPIVVTSVLALFTSNARGDLIYTLENYPAFQNGHTLSGTITTTDTAPDDGLLMNSEILDWAFSVTGPTSFMAAKNPASFEVVTGNVGISPTQITLAAPVIDPGHNEFFLDFETGTGPSVRYLRILDLNDPMGAGVIDEYSAFPAIGSDVWQEVSGAPLGGDVGEPWVIATRATAVPEPSTFLLLSFVLTAVAGPALRKRHVA